MIKTGIIGATGYAGQQLVSLLINHPEAEVTFVSSNSYAGQSFSDIYPQFYRILDQKLLSTEEAKAAIGDVDVVFTALPNGLVFEIAEIAMEKGTKIVDFSADFRLDDPAVYEEWYKTKHTAPQLGQPAGLRSAGAVERQDPQRTARGQSGMLYDGQHPGRLCSPERRGTGG